MSAIGLPPGLLQAFRREARALDGVDAKAYASARRDPLQPIIGLGPADAPICFMGRDPGRDEVRLGLPFVGEAGQLLRRGLHAQRHPGAPYTFEAGLLAGQSMFWMNTVPYKPAGNKAWSVRVRERFQPLLAALLACWQGSEVITLGNEAFFWFALRQSKTVRDQLARYWKSGDSRYEGSVEVLLQLPGGDRSLRIHPLPHPSRANAIWCRRFPALLQQRLETILGPGGNTTAGRGPARSAPQ